MATPTTLPASFVSGAVLTAAQMNDLRGAFRVLQVLQTVKTDTFSTTSTTFVDVTGLTRSITPSSTSSKILLIGQVNLGGLDTTNLESAYVRFSGGNSSTYIGDAASNRVRAAGWAMQHVGGYAMHVGPTHAITLVYLDSPATTSATTYAIQARVGAAQTAYVNRVGWDLDQTGFGRMSSSLTVMEISA